jgi:histidinol-phosphate/aromatic aminotransferase/cobyric acid decarboxylase-like protein
LAEHNQKLDQLRKTAAALKVRLQDYFHDQYFDQQANFIMGRDPNKANIAELQASELQNFLAALLSIQNRDAPFPDLLIPALIRFTEGVDQFNSWLSGCEARLSELKQIVL